MENLAEINPNLILPFPYNTSYGLGENNSTDISDTSSVSETSDTESVVLSDKSTMTIPEDASFEDFSLNFLLKSENSDVDENPEHIEETSDHEISEQFEKVMNYINKSDLSDVSGDSDLDVEFENNGKQKLQVYDGDDASTDLEFETKEILQSLTKSDSSNSVLIQQSISDLENEFNKLKADNASDVSNSIANDAEPIFGNGKDNQANLETAEAVSSNGKDNQADLETAKTVSSSGKDSQPGPETAEAVSSSGKENYFHNIFSSIPTNEMGAANHEDAEKKMAALAEQLSTDSIRCEFKQLACDHAPEGSYPRYAKFLISNDSQEPQEVSTVEFDDEEGIKKHLQSYISSMQDNTNQKSKSLSVSSLSDVDLEETLKSKTLNPELTKIVNEMVEQKLKTISVDMSKKFERSESP